MKTRNRRYPRSSGMNGDKSGESGTFLFSRRVPDFCDGRRSFPTNENSNLDGRGRRLPSAMDFAHFQSPKSLGSSPPITNKHFPFPAKFVIGKIWDRPLANIRYIGKMEMEMGWSATRKIPDRLRFSRHMKTTLFSHAILSYFARVQIYLKLSFY